MKVLLRTGLALGLAGSALTSTALAEPPEGRRSDPGTGGAAVLQPEGAAPLHIAAGRAGLSEATDDDRLAQTYGTTEDGEMERLPGWYLTIGAGASWPQSLNGNTGRIREFDINDVDVDWDLDGGFSGEVGVGYDFGAIRTELTYVYNNNSVNDVDLDINGNDFDFDVDGDIDSNSVFLSAYWDIPVGSERFVPYVGGGIGYTNLSWAGFTIDGEDDHVRISGDNVGLFGWQAKAGVSYALSCTSDIYVEGTYQGASGFESGGVDYSSLNSWGARGGLRWRFAGCPKVVVVEPAPMPEPEPMPEPMPEPAPMPMPEPIRGLW